MTNFDLSSLTNSGAQYLVQCFIVVTVLFTLAALTDLATKKPLCCTEASSMGARNTVCSDCANTAPGPPVAGTRLADHAGVADSPYRLSAPTRKSFRRSRATRATWTVAIEHAAHP